MIYFNLNLIIQTKEQQKQVKDFIKRYKGLGEFNAFEIKHPQEIKNPNKVK